MSSLKVEFRAQRSLLQSLHETQQEHTGRLTRLESKVDTLESKVDTLESKVDLVHAGVTAIRTLLERDPGSDG